MNTTTLRWAHIPGVTYPAPKAVKRVEPMKGRIMQMAEAKRTPDEIAAEVGLSADAVRKALRAAGISGRYYMA